jgi:hypothetical protein
LQRAWQVARTWLIMRDMRNDFQWARPPDPPVNLYEPEDYPKLDQPREASRGFPVRGEGSMAAASPRHKAMFIALAIDLGWAVEMEGAG